MGTNPVNPKPKANKKKKNMKNKNKNIVKMIKPIVQSLISKNEEPKMNIQTVTAQPITIYSPPTSDLFTYDVSSVTYIGQGVTQNSRVGNRISPTSLKLRGCISIINSTITANMFFRIIVLSKKVGIDSTAGSYTYLFQSGAFSTGPGGTLLDLMRPVNTDWFKVAKQKRLFIGSSDSATSIMPGNSTATAQMFSMDLTKYVPKTLVYNDTINFPSNFGLYLAIVPVNANGVSTSNSQLLAFQTTIELQLVYRDA